MTVPRRLLTVSAITLVSAICASLWTGSAAAASQRAAAARSSLGAADAYLPPKGKTFTGVATLPLSEYTHYIHRHPAVYQEFVAWGQYIPSITRNATRHRARMMMMIGTKYGRQNKITPESMANGHGDHWLIPLGRQIAASGNVTYIRLMSEMDNHNNAYCGFNANGSSRGPAYSPREFKQAWRRVTLIMRGGSVKAIDARLHRLHMPRLRTHSRRLPEGKVAMVWAPMVAGNPAIPANQPRAYFPGRAYVDWVGTDFYSSFPNFTGLTSFFKAYRHYPFAFGEYAIWGADNPTFVRELFHWIGHRRQVQMLSYNDDAPVFRLSNYPGSARALRHALSRRRYLAYAPEWRPRHKHRRHKR